MNDRYDAPYDLVTQALTQTGWLDDTRSIGPKDVEGAVLAYQEFHKLKVDGWAGQITERSLQAPRMCALPDRMRSTGAFPRFENAHITWSLDNQATGEVIAIFKAAWKSWESVCGISTEYTDNGRVRIHFGRIDRAGGTLAWSELAPLNGRAYLTQRYDKREPWHIGLGVIPQWKVDLLAVATHEIGHALGVDHLSVPGNLMNPIYDASIRSPQLGDIKQVFERYGGSFEGPELARCKVVVSLGADRYAGKLLKLGGG